MINFSYKTSGKTENFLNKILRKNPKAIMEHYGRLMVNALKYATPVDSGKSSESWDYEIAKDSSGYMLSITNDNLSSTGVPIVIYIQYGHGTRNGTFVKGNDFINPAIKRLMNEMSKELQKGV